MGDLPGLCRPFNMLYCTLSYLFYAILACFLHMIYCFLSYLFYAILACFLHIGRLLDGFSVFHVILLDLLKDKRMIKIDSVSIYIQRQINHVKRQTNHLFKKDEVRAMPILRKLNDISLIYLLLF